MDITIYGERVQTLKLGLKKSDKSILPVTIQHFLLKSTVFEKFYFCCKKVDTLKKKAIFEKNEKLQLQVTSYHLTFLTRINSFRKIRSLF